MQQVRRLSSVQVLTFSRDEQETVLLFDYEKGQWLFETTIGKHITKAKQKFGDILIVTAVDKNGRATRVRCWLPENVIWFKSINE